MKNILLVAVIFMILISCENTTRENPSSENAEEQTSSENSGMTFKGTLPCADCEGIETTLQLFIDNTQATKSYKLTETYLGKPEPENTFTTEGNYVALYYEDSTLVIYRLNPEDPATARYYRKISDDEMMMMSPAAENIDSKLNYTLKRK
jgi:copper homeostasis protein (lipoprotein)